MEAFNGKFKVFELVEFDEDEQLICKISKHPFGIFLIYLVGLFIALTIMFAGIAASLWLEGGNHGLPNSLEDYSWLVLGVAVVLSALVILGSAVYAYIFSNNLMIVTNEKVAQVLYHSLFNRKISQLNISDVQDVTVHQKGIMARLLNYGTLVVETAGEQQNYTFTFAPNPAHISRLIITAHEKNVEIHGN